MARDAIEAVSIPPAPRRGSTVGWVVAFVFFPYGPFVYLAWLKVLSLLRASVLVMASAVVHIGLVSVLGQTNGRPWQVWVELLLGVSLYALGWIQYNFGQQHGLWNATGYRLWRAAGWFFGVLLMTAILVQVLLFHFAPSAR